MHCGTQYSLYASHGLVLLLIGQKSGARFFSRHNDGIKDYLNTGALYVFSLTRPTVHDIERTTSVVGSVGYTSISLLTANFTGVFIT